MKSQSQKIAVCGKGGTGKSTMVVLLANVLRQEGYTVLVIDSDESNPGLPRLLGLGAPLTPLISLLKRFSQGDRKPEASWLEAARIPLEWVRSSLIRMLRFLTQSSSKDNDDIDQWPGLLSFGA